VPSLDYGFVPTGSVDSGEFLERVASALSFGQDRVACVRADLERRLRHFVRRASPQLLLGDVQKTVAVVGSSANAVGVARFLSGTLGQIVELVVISDDVEEDARARIADLVRQAAPRARVEFSSRRASIARHLADARPELVLGSGLEVDLARDVRAAFLEFSAPLRQRPTFLRGYAGVRGAVLLIEDLLASLIAQSERARPSLAASPRLQENAP
jgi:nitrogenase molybdenum-iron protein beta chain